MNKIKKRWRVVVIVLVIMGVLFFFWMMFLKNSWWKWEEDDRTLWNPDRGFYIQIDSENPERIPEAAKEVRVILLAFDIEGYTEEDLPEEKLNGLLASLKAAEEAGVSVIFRAAYGFCGDVLEPDSIEWMGRHIGQISVLLNRHPDQILTVQAGMLGAYGEWHSSRYLEGGYEAEKESRLYILSQWEKSLDPNIKVAVRRPRFIREAEQEKILLGRIGLHNDALLSTYDDMGTYDDVDFTRKEELLWAERNLLGQINGGEMPEPGKRNEPEYADLEFQKLHLEYLNLKYNKDIISSWENGKLKGMEARQYLENRLGYRIFLSELGAKKMYAGKSLSQKGVELSLSFCNTGYAPLLSKYKMFFFVRSGKKEVSEEVPASGLYQICNKKNWKKKFRIKIPEEFLQEKEISVGIKLAQKQEETDKRNCIEFANKNFDYKDGINGIFSLKRVGGLFYQIELQK